MSDVLIKLENVSKKFFLGKKNVVTALENVNLEIFSGEYISIMGPSGSGKTTLFNMIGVLDTPTTGKITIGETDLKRLTPLEQAFFRGTYLGYVFQSFNLLPQYSAIENVALPLIFSGKSYSASLERAKEVLESVGLGNRLHHKPDELSGGQQQRVAIARALANKPLIILADEPTGNLDLHTGEEIITLLKELSVKYHVTVVSATHDYKMLSTSDRIVWIADGKIEKIQKREEIEIKVGTILQQEKIK